MSNGSEARQTPRRAVRGKLIILALAPVAAAALASAGAFQVADPSTRLLIGLGAAAAAAFVGLVPALRLDASLARSMAELAGQAESGWRAALEASQARDSTVAAVERHVAAPARGLTRAAEALAAADLPARHKRAAQAMARSGASLQAMIGDIVDATAGEPAAPELNSAGVDAAEIAEDVCALSWAAARSRGLDLAAFVDPATPRLIDGDTVRLRQVLAALVGDAIQSTDAGGVMLQVAPRGKDLLRVSVHDTRAVEATLESPTGEPAPAELGLAICRRLIEAMGGTFKVVGKPGKGVAVACDLPMSVIEPAPPWPALASGVQLMVAGPATKWALRRYLKATGAELAADDAKPGSASALVIADAGELRGRPRCHAPVVCLAAPGDTLPGELRRAGLADVVLTHPLRRRDIEAILSARSANTPLAQSLVDDATAAPAAGAGGAAGPMVTSELLDPQVAGELARMAAAGKADFVDRVRRLYRENAPLAVKAVIDASVNRDVEEVARAAHALKSMSTNMGARVVAETAGRIEAQARDLGVVNVDQTQILHRQLLATLDVLDGYPPTSGQSPSSSAPDDREKALLEDLAEAIEKDELALVYQPQFDRDGAAITGVETLLRWNHPVRGFVSPAMFIPLAERHGLIGPITQWVLERAMTETEDLDGIVISFNASAVEFADPAFVDELSVLIARRRFDPRRLEIEVTETAVLAEEDEVRRNMARLHELGLKIALDDFGVGYSSLSHLRLFPFDKLKIDRAFVTGCAENVQSATLVNAVVSIGRSLGMKVIAEGVETAEQQSFLKEAGVHGMQGYLFAKPEPIAALRARLGIMQREALSA